MADMKIFIVTLDELDHLASVLPRGHNDEDIEKELQAYRLLRLPLN